MNIIKEIIARSCGLGSKGELILNRTDGVQEVFGLVATVTVSSAELLALNATPKLIIAAPGANRTIVPRRVAIFKVAGTAYAGIAAGEDLVLKYTNTSGAQCSGVIETTGFLDQATDQTRVAHAPSSTGSTASDYSPANDANVVLHLLVGEITTGTSALQVRVWYDIIQTKFSV